MRIKSTTLTACRRCGTCCIKGGPAFHIEDRLLIDSGRIPAKHLVTLRKGELVSDDINGRLIALESEMIKIKGQNRAWTCVFYDHAEFSCLIYTHRPLECRILKCWNTREIAAMYRLNRLTRKDLFSEIPALLSLIEDHDRRCSLARLKTLLDSKTGDTAAKKGIQEMVEYDRSIRMLVIEKACVEPDMLDFIFGRPLPEAMAGRL